MACYSPLRGWRSRSVSASGKRPLVFNQKDGFSDMPVDVPCGVCMGCRIDHSRQWALRCVHESKLHHTSSFLTLTYSPEHLPENGVLVKKDLQDFVKRLRQHLVRKYWEPHFKYGPVNYPVSYPNIRYFASGEYGEENERPHYHFLLFGYNFASDRKKHSKNKRGDQYYESEVLNGLWPLGRAVIGDFNYSTAAYTARYVVKKYRGKSPELHYSRTNLATGEQYLLTPEFSIMSLKPAIGRDWYDRYQTDFFPSDKAVHDGKIHPIPKYYVKRLEVSNPMLHKKVKDKRRKSLQDHPDLTPDRLRVREIVKLSQISMLRRTI